MSSITADKRETILSCAAKAFAKIGFKKTSVDEIARLAGVAKGTVYLAAPSKEDLFYQVVYREVRQWQAHSFQFVDPREPADKLLLTLVTEATKYVTSRQILVDLLCGKLGESMPKWTQRFDDLRAIGRATLIEVLKLGVRQGVFREGMDIETVASLLQDFQLAPWMLRGPMSVEENIKVGNVGVDLILNGLRQRAASK
jgi:AcrR family transcriptional regulator